MTTYSDWAQRQLDIKSGDEMARREERRALLAELNKRCAKCNRHPPGHRGTGLCQSCWEKSQ